MDFEWDEAKNQANIAKHGISFEQASRIFQGPIFSVEDDRFDYGEKRLKTTGMIDDVLVIVVIHSDRQGRIRLISARKADREERNEYKAQIQARPDA